ncbi:MAG: hypothetical protein SFV17_07655 [Candidatus Obscuribacter sp.]|nr:hypothetical protein [Candidatus Melainabacteria bacterium]MDX1986546.1 hypothetical protein [Candidatus Obscuribacter sp.]
MTVFRLTSITARSILLLSAANLAFALLSQPPGQAADSATKYNTSTARVMRMPVKEVTIFKDGHAVINQEGSVAVNNASEVVLDRLPTPVLGTFFPYSLEGERKLISVTAGQRKIKSSMTALSLEELIAGNIGAAVRVDELLGNGENTKLLSYDARIVGIPTRSAEEQAENMAQGTNPGLILPQKSHLVELKTETGNTFVPIARIQTLSFKGEHNSKDQEEELRNVLTLKLEEHGRNPGGEANVGMMYVERGLRWIPSYKVTIDGSGHARVKLQATIVNDLIDLEDVNANLVVGVPSFAFKDDTDPIALGQTLAQVAHRAGQESRLRNTFSNAIMTQSAMPLQADDQGGAAVNPEGSKAEDMYVFSIKHLTLKKGERAVLPVQEYQVEYKDLYTLDLPLMPPQEMQSSGQQMDERTLANLAEALKVLHKIRLVNSSKQPFTTAPALIVSSDKGKSEVLAQGMMTYASPGSVSELTITTAVDIKVKKVEKETGRVQDAVTWQDNKYARINLNGLLQLTNFTGKPVTVEISRKVMGKLDDVSSPGKMEMLNPLEEWSKVGWHSYYSFPGWWSHMNGMGKFVSHQELSPGESSELKYNWHYFWRY